ncbi:acyl-CoA dehydrogenase [Imbroritus primus]|uniref:Acyl-CoA dehydrogenase n=1 Tax=Imbroritus primus TaxID=3058603 RepID=A0ACD3STD1_9BURK|nr:acyl-CoA dehydrogenase [Burkholderiaceae bacterium PBA]
MNLTLSDEQEMIRDSVHDYFTGAYDFEAHLARVAAGRDNDNGIDRARWQAMAELGWLGLTAPEAAGGLGAGPEETMVLMEGAGAALCIEPLLPTVALGVPLLAEGAKGSPAADALARVMAGQASVAVAWTESAHGFAPLSIATTAQATTDGGYRLDGHKVLVENGADAEWIVIPARTNGSDNAADGISLFLVPRDVAGLGITPVRMLDGSRSADLALEQVEVPATHLIGQPSQGGKLLTAAVYRGLAASCAEALGAMRRALDICKSYLHERQQFGKPLAAFQALQHRYVEMLIAEERARSLTMLAAIRLRTGDLDDPETLRDLSLAKLGVGRSARMIGGNAIQLHGGMGMAYEYPIGHYYRKLLCCDAAFGSQDDHLALLAHQLAPQAQAA